MTPRGEAWDRRRVRAGVRPAAGRIREEPRCAVSAGGMPAFGPHAWGGGMLD